MYCMVSVTPSEADVDYADFRYQQGDALLKMSKGSDADNPDRLVGAVDFEPLQGSGGMAPNQYAELVYLEANIYVDRALQEDETNQSQLSSTFATAAVGSNLDSRNDLPEYSNVGADGEILLDKDEDDSQSEPFIAQTTQTNDAVFGTLQLTNSAAFIDKTNSLGGGGSSESGNLERNFRALTGRGPVLDQNDDLSVVISAVANNNINDLQIHVQLYAIWDIAETDDAGRRFSVDQM